MTNNIEIVKLLLENQKIDVKAECILNTLIFKYNFKNKFFSNRIDLSFLIKFKKLFLNTIFK